MRLKIQKFGWWVAVISALLSVGYLRVADAFIGGPVDWTEIQRGQQAIAHFDMQIRYVCVNDIGYDLGESGPLDLTEDRLILDAEVARQRCALPGIPDFVGANTLMVATTPGAEYGAALLSLRGAPRQALAKVTGELTEAGWQENKEMDQESKDFGTSLTWKDSRLFLVDASHDDQPHETTLLLLGNFHSKNLR